MNSTSTWWNILYVKCTLLYIRLLLDWLNSPDLRPVLRQLKECRVLHLNKSSSPKQEFFT